MPVLRYVQSLALAGALSSGGCALFPEPEGSVLEADVEVPDRFSERADAAPVATTGWVSEFEDVKLTGLVREAQRANRDLKVTRARIEAARANAVIAGADQMPQIGGSVDGSRSSRNFIGFPVGGGDQQVQTTLVNVFNLGLDMRWEVDLWGRIQAGKDAALRELLATEADFAALQLSIAAQTAQGWFGLIAARQQVELAEEALKIFEQTEATIRGEFEEGIVAQGRDVASELQLALSDVENARAELMRRREILNRAGKQLEVVLGRYPAGRLLAAARLPRLTSPPPAGLPASLLDRRPDLQAATQRLAAADDRVMAARRSLLPAITLTGSYGTSTPEFNEILNSDFIVWNIAGSAAQPLLDGKRLRQTVKLRRAEAEQALADFEGTALNAFREVEEALAADRFLAQRQRALEKSVTFSGQALERARESYATGVGDVLTLLRAQQQFIQARASLIDVKQQRLDNRVNLHLALGGDFETATQESGPTAGPPPDIQ